jgi:hypothetical protein
VPILLSKSGATGETKKAAQRFLAIRALAVETVTASTRRNGFLATRRRGHTVRHLVKVQKPAIRHHPPGNSDSCSTG